LKKEKKMLNRLVINLTLLLMFIPSQLFTQVNLSGRDIMVKVDEKPDGDDMYSTLKMTLINKRGKKRERIIASWSKDYGKDKKTVMYFRKPADVRGTGFLSHEWDDPSQDDDRWLYLPALKKVRRISGSSKNDYFMGSDFTYDDMGDRSVDEDKHLLLKEETIDGFTCWVIESQPVDENYMYSKVIRWIRQDALISVKTEFYDRRGELLKSLTVSDIRKHQGYWTIFKMHMDNIQENHQTILEFDEVNYDTGIKDNLFKVSTLERGRIK
jgi:hypothetical protein